MSKRDKGPVERGKDENADPNRYKTQATDQSSGGDGDQTARDGATDRPVGTAAPAADGADGAQSAAGEVGGANPGTAPPQDAVREEPPAVVNPVAGDPIIDRDPGDEAFLREHGAAERTVDESAEYNQERDAAIEGLHDGPGGRKYLVLNLTDDSDALEAAKAYGMAIRQNADKAELANQLLRIAGVNVGRL